MRKNKLKLRELNLSCFDTIIIQTKKGKTFKGTYSQGEAKESYKGGFRYSNRFEFEENTWGLYTQVEIFRMNGICPLFVYNPTAVYSAKIVLLEKIQKRTQSDGRSIETLIDNEER